MQQLQGMGVPFFGAGARTLRQVSFVTPVSIVYDMPSREEDGLLPTLLVQRIFICVVGHYAVLDPH